MWDIHKETNITWFKAVGSEYAGVVFGIKYGKEGCKYDEAGYVNDGIMKKVKSLK